MLMITTEIVYRDKFVQLLWNDRRFNDINDILKMS